MTLKIAMCGQIAVFALVFAGAISATQAQIVVKSVADPPSQVQGSNIAVRSVADPLTQTPRSTIVLRSGPNSLLQAQGSTTSVRSVLQPQTLAQSSGGAAGGGCIEPEPEELDVIPGGLLRLPLAGRMVSVVIGDYQILDVLPTTDTGIFLLGKKVGITQIAVLGEKSCVVFQGTVSVHYPPPPGSAVSIYNGEKLSNFTSYWCGKLEGCVVSAFHEIRREDLPKGYSSFQDTSGGQGSGGSRPAPTQTYQINP